MARGPIARFSRNTRASSPTEKVWRRAGRCTIPHRKGAGGAAMEERQTGKSALLPGARCAKHVQRMATGVCSRCGDYLCGLCGRRVELSLCCEGCAEHLTREHSPRAFRAFVLG